VFIATDRSARLHPLSVPTIYPTFPDEISRVNPVPVKCVLKRSAFEALCVVLNTDTQVRSPDDEDIAGLVPALMYCEPENLRPKPNLFTSIGKDALAIPVLLPTKSLYEPSPSVLHA
jgi:hypothetical protein